MGSINVGNAGRFIPQVGQTPAAQDVSGGMFEAGQRVGGTVQNIGDRMMTQALHEQTLAQHEAKKKADEAEREADASAVFAARRKLDDWERVNVYDPQQGAITKRGADAFGLPQTLPSAFDKSAQEIGKDLVNPRQRMAFAEVANSRRNQIGSFADRHALQERRTYDEGQYQADVTSSLNRAALVASTGDTAASAAEVAIAQTRTTGYMRSLGKSEEEIAGAVRAVSSKASVTTINLLLDQDLPMKADEYLKANAGAMNVEDLLRTKMAVSKAVDARVGLTVANDVIKGSVMPALAPTDTVRLATLAGADFNRLNDAKRQIESGNRDFNKDGSVVTSPKGAKGRDQVMDATNRDPGFGVVPARDDSLAERSRVGTDYLAAMIREYKGDVSKALAAYNGGPGAVDKAVKLANQQRTENWLAKMPAETQAYVVNVSKKYAAGGGAPELPTLQALHQQVRDRVGMDSPQRLQTALADVTRQYDDAIKSKKQGEEKAASTGMQWLMDNGGRMSEMPAAIRNQIPPKEIDNLMSFGQKMSKGDDITDDRLYFRLTTNPEAMAKMSDAEFLLLRPGLSQKDYEHFTAKRAEILSGKSSAAPGSLNDGAVNRVLNQRITGLGLDPTPKDGSNDAQRIGAMRRFVDSSLLDAQRQSGKKFDDAQTQQHIDALFAQNIQFRKTFMGFNTGTTGMNMLSMRVGDIPDSDKKKLEDAFKATGNSKPTDADLLGAYWASKANNDPRTGRF